MEAKFYKVEFSAENLEQANDILNQLLKDKAVTGGQIINAPARFLWKDAVTNMDYYTVWAFTIEAYTDEIIETVKSLSKEEVPMIWFTPIKGNDELITWISETLHR